jgi:hypothetical protein
MKTFWLEDWFGYFVKYWAFFIHLVTLFTSVNNVILQSVKQLYANKFKYFL